MSHYTVKYESMNPVEKHNAAIADCKNYLGESGFNQICDRIEKYPDLTLNELHLALSFVGIQGYPVTAIFNHCFPENKGV